jgi:3-hydroxymyristoyl/3-hydroxydecanoyl-(acyl carrier protein) dehydratase
MPGGTVGDFTIGDTHPSLLGHFPGDPIVPGIVLLDHVLALVIPSGLAAIAVPSVKFLRPVRPGEILTVSAGPAHGGRIAFAARAGMGEVLHGVVDVRSSAESHP